ncbi:hypothetical protein BV378_13990 [Nostoc sp. RF31YmG]|jgi:hypothetical protein|nr:hypothetical protein BV378_13990 [Nostoc sp. RF31YmG]
MPNPVPPSATIVGDFARAHGFTHGEELPWLAAVAVLEHLHITRHVDLGERETYLGDHPTLGTIALIMSSISACWVFAYEELGPRLQRYRDGTAQGGDFVMDLSVSTE